MVKHVIPKFKASFPEYTSSNSFAVTRAIGLLINHEKQYHKKGTMWKLLIRLEAILILRLAFDK